MCSVYGTKSSSASIDISDKYPQNASMEGKMTDKEEIFKKIDDIIIEVDKYKIDPGFSEVINKRQTKPITEFKTDRELLKSFAHIIAYSHSNSKRVEDLLATGKFDEAFQDFDIDKVVIMNPCDLAERDWSNIKAIQQQVKLFHIVNLARRLKSISRTKAPLFQTFNDLTLPKSISTVQDISTFWKGFDDLQKKLKAYNIPFLHSTTSLLHFLMHNGYDCVKPDLVVMKFFNGLNIVDEKKAVKIIQEYCVYSKKKPSVVDFYLLIKGRQKSVEKYVKKEFYQ